MSEASIEDNGCRVEPQSQWVPSGRGLRKGWRPKAAVFEAGEPGFEYVIAPRDAETFPTKEEADAFMVHWARRWLERRQLKRAIGSRG